MRSGKVSIRSFRLLIKELLLPVLIRRDFGKKGAAKYSNFTN